MKYPNDFDYSEEEVECEFYARDVNKVADKMGWDSSEFCQAIGEAMSYKHDFKRIHALGCPVKTWDGLRRWFNATLKEAKSNGAGIQHTR